MQPATIYSAQVSGLRGEIITLEVDLFRGFQSFNIVGLPDKAVEESRDRISSAVRSIGFESPKSKPQKIIISLAPADLKKEGPNLDLPMALGYLLAKRKIRFNPFGKIFLGELSLSGKLRPIKGALLLARAARERGFGELFLPRENASEAALIRGIKVYGAGSLREVVSHVNEKRLDKEFVEKSGLDGVKLPVREETKLVYKSLPHAVNFEDVKEQESAKRGLLIAASGGHNVCFYGPPGTGKTLLAKAFASILPPLTFDEALEVTGIYSAAHGANSGLVTAAPFRAPHHTSSYISIIGGGTFPKPGEVTLAHRGVLFLDEFPEFDRRVIESLRQPLEDGVVSISRARGTETFPAEFILVAALNPCPCGYHGDPKKECSCMPSILERYKRKVSGPIIDRIDMWIEVPRIAHEKLSEAEGAAARKGSAGRETTLLREKIQNARARQQERFRNSPAALNSRMDVRTLKEHVVLGEKTKRTLDAAASRLDLSGRAYHRVMKLARTIADLEDSARVSEDHILEALQYRPRKIF